jgi:hypothetical protein
VTDDHAVAVDELGGEPQPPHRPRPAGVVVSARSAG